MKWPSIKDVAAELRSINSMEVESDEEGASYIDVRLQVMDDGHWKVWWGDSQYDWDHRGYWGASSVPGNRKRFKSQETARELIEEARDSWHMNQPLAPNPHAWGKVFG